MLMLGVSHALASWLVVKVLAVLAVLAVRSQISVEPERGDDDGCEHSTGPNSLTFTRLHELGQRSQRGGVTTDTL